MHHLWLCVDDLDFSLFQSLEAILFDALGDLSFDADGQSKNNTVMQYYGSREVQFPARRPFPHADVRSPRAESHLRMRTYVLRVRKRTSACGDALLYGGRERHFFVYGSGKFFCHEITLRSRLRNSEVRLRLRSQTTVPPPKFRSQLPAPNSHHGSASEIIIIWSTLHKRSNRV